jgi:hypothetical protein
MGKLNWKSQVSMDIQQSEESKQKEIEALKQQLTSTDFYVIRQVEVGTVIPDDIKTQRATIRQRLNALGL